MIYLIFKDLQTRFVQYFFVAYKLKYPMFLSKNVALLMICLGLGATQCSTQPIPPISGRIVLAEGWKPRLYLVQPRSFSEIASNFSGAIIDSAAIAADGSFAFSKRPVLEEKQLLELCAQLVSSRFPNQLLDDHPLKANYMPIVIQPGETLEITADISSLQATCSIKQPSATNTALLSLRDLRHHAFRQEQLAQQQGSDDHDEAALLEREAALLRFRQPLMAFADTCSLLLPSLVAARWVSTDGDYERVPEFLVRQCQKWSQAEAKSQWVGQLCKAGNRANLPVLTGDKMPNAPLPMASGDTVLLHALLGSRLTVLDIWASWCAPCRRENRDVLAPLWAQYQAAGLQIIGYSIDSSPAAWKAAIVKDGASWPHASHLSGDAAPLMDTLRIITIPANFILDNQGKVIAKNLHGATLKDFVEAYLK